MTIDLTSGYGNLLQPADATNIGERFRRIRAAYAHHQAMVEKGVSSWMFDDPYQIADWLRIFTPIEQAAWADIRAAGIPLWPQLPVGRFFVDFGNPVAKVALECDGAAWHLDAAKDAARDAELARMGWRVFRATGRVCKVELDRPDNWDDLTPEQRQKWRDDIEKNSLRPILAEIKQICERNFMGDLA